MFYNLQHFFGLVNTFSKNKKTLWIVANIGIIEWSKKQRKQEYS